MSCKCILQSGLNKGNQCGRAIKTGNTCGVHKNKCILKSPPRTQRRSTVDAAIVKFVVEIDPELINGKAIKEFLRLNFPNEKMTRERKELAQQIYDEKMKRLASTDCKKCMQKYEALRI